MWIDTDEARQLIESAARRHVKADEVQNVVATVRRVVTVSSVDEIQALVTVHPFLASDWVLRLLSSVWAELREEGDRRTVHNLSSTMLTLSFVHERRLRDKVVVPRAIAADYKRWSALARRSTLTAAEVTQLSDLAQRMVASNSFEEIDEIARRDIYQDTAKQLLKRYNESPDDAASLNTAIEYFSEATSLCPNESIDFVRCTFFGGLSLLIRAQKVGDMRDVDTVILVLRYAVAAADDNYLENFVGPSTHALARAYMMRFEYAHDEGDLAAAHEIFVYGVSNVRARGYDFQEDMPVIASMLSDALRRRGDTKRLAELTEVLAGTE